MSNYPIDLTTKSLLLPQSRLSETSIPPIKAVYPLVNLRYFSHHKYHLVKEQIRQNDRQFHRSVSLSKLKPMLKHSETMAEHEEKPRLARMETMKLPTKPVKPGSKLETKANFAPGKIKIKASFWMKKMMNMEKSLGCIERVRDRTNT